VTIDSAVPLPDLPAGEGAADVFVRLGDVRSSSDEEKDSSDWVEAEGEQVVFHWEGVGSFLIREGREIVVDPEPGVEERVVRLFITGVSLSVLLQQRGCAVFHASAVQIGGRAVAFMGGKRSGKSTLAAVLNSRGHNLISDDVMVYENDAGPPEVLPGPPQVKLWPESVSILGESPDLFPKIHPMLEKRSRSVGDRFARRPVALGAVFLLDKGPDHRIEPLSVQEALTEVMPHWYGARFGEGLFHALGPVQHLRQCSHLVSAVSVSRLERRDALDSLTELAQMVEDRLGGKR
jgi:hypothetical protein